MPATLSQIVEASRLRAAERKQAAGFDALEQRAQAHIPRGFRAALLKRTTSGVAVIAELKKASPSRGIIRADFDVPDLARQYAAAGAVALSVLTEEQFFQGSLEYLRAASAAVALPCLRKDFIVEEFQLLEARAWHADAVLLLASVLDDGELARLYARACELQLDVLCEVHDEIELQRALRAGCNVIGVNNRDLRTFHVDLETALRLAPRIPPGIVKVAESGIHSAADLARLREAGFDAFLIGESLMRAERPGEALARLLESP
jgi:indole-3-glycerol phosphate synthase